jgi:hypothetical protein
MELARLSKVYYLITLQNPKVALICTSFLKFCTRWRSWLERWAKSPKVASSFPYGVTGIFQAKQKWVPGVSPGGKRGLYVGLTTMPPSCTECLEMLGASPSLRARRVSIGIDLLNDVVISNGQKL